MAGSPAPAAPDGRAHKTVDAVQQRIATYAWKLSYADIPPEVVHIIKSRIVDTMGVLIGGFFGEPCSLGRNVAAAMPNDSGATVLGTRIKTSPDMAAFVNGTTSRYLECNDVYQWPGSAHGHPSDTVAPVFAAAEYLHSSGRELITAVAVAYEIYCRIADVFHNVEDFDTTMFGCLGTAAGAGKLFCGSSEQIAHAISMAVVPNVVLKQIRRGHATMCMNVASGLAGRAGVFAAMLARSGMEGPHLPFEGKAGWCAHVAKEKLLLAQPMGGENAGFRIVDTYLKMRTCMSEMISPVLAAEKIAPVADPASIASVVVETNAYAKRAVGTSDNRPIYNPDSREVADHSIPYVIAATLLEGTLTPRSFDDAHLWNPALRALLPKIDVQVSEEFSNAYKRHPREHLARVTVVRSDGKRLVGEAGRDEDALSTPKTDAQISAKFRRLTEDVLGAKRAAAVLDRLWHLDEISDVAELPPLLVLV